MIEFLPMQGGGGTAVPFYRENAPQHLGAHSARDALRLKRYEEHWKFYQGNHWSFTRESGEPLITSNYARAIVNKKASWVVGKGVIWGTPSALNDVTKPVIVETWKQNDEPVKLLEMAVTGSVTGDVFVLVVWKPATAVQLAVDPTRAGYIRIRLLRSEQVFPIWNPLDMEELQAVKVITEVPIERQPDPLPVNSRIVQNPAGAPTKRKYVEVIGPNYILEGWEGEEPRKTVNPLGEIPFVHWANEVFPGEYFGLSDLDGIIDLQRELNEKMTDISDIVAYHAAPTTIITGAKAKNLEKGPKNLWAGLPSDAKVFNLQLGGELPASHKYLELVRQMMFDIAGLPEGSLGRIQAISNTSAAALEVQFQPLIEATDRKRATFKIGLEKINYFILRLDQLMNKKLYPLDLCGDCGGRIVRFKVKGRDGIERIKKKCYLVDPQTLDFLAPDDVKVNVVVEHSFGNETRLMKFSRVKQLWGKKSPSYWDPEPMIDKTKEALVHKEQQEAEIEEQKQEMESAAEAEHGRNMEVKHGPGGVPPSEEDE